jgi:hypothetical protein
MYKFNKEMTMKENTISSLGTIRTFLREGT